MASMTVVGGGLAGCEAAWQLAERGHSVDLLEMRPERPTPAHETGDLAELVCANSLKSTALGTAHGALKAELGQLGSLLLSLAERHRVPAGQALAVDRRAFARAVTCTLQAHPRIELRRQECETLPQGPEMALLAAGPLVSEPLAGALADLLGAEHLYFYDAIAPIVERESVDERIAFWASRYGKGDADYLNCPMNRQEYETFYRALLQAERVTPRGFERAMFFDACQPVERIAESGPESLTFGPLKPVGLVDPRIDGRPWAVVQLRREDEAGSSFNMVGFQTRLTFSEQRRVFRLIPGLGEARFLRFGSIHRNTYLNAPVHLDPDLALKAAPHLFVAGQLSGGEGYVESIATGLWAALQMDARARATTLPAPPTTTTLGGLLGHLRTARGRRFQPSNVHWGLVQPLQRAPRRRRDRRAALGERALREMTAWVQQVGLRPAAEPPQAAASDSGQG